MRMNIAVIIVLVVSALIAWKIYDMAARPMPPSMLYPLVPPTAEAPEFRDTVPSEAFFREGFAKNGLAGQWDFFRTQLRPEIQMLVEPANESSFLPGQSKIGGQPDLPAGMAWFTEGNGNHLSFIAQINLAEVRSLDTTGQLPSTGILYFFYSTEYTGGYDILDKDKFRVYYYDGDSSSLLRTHFPYDLGEYSRYKPCRLRFRPSVSLPDRDLDYVSARLNGEESRNYYDVTKNYYTGTNKLLGHSDNIQNPMELECEMVTHGIYLGEPSGFNDPRLNEMKKNSRDWILLFQLDSNDEAGMMWGDAGMLYFWIKKEDLRQKKFDRCWMISQCG